MNPRPLTMSASYLATVRGLRELHRLTAAGLQDSPEADLTCSKGSARLAEQPFEQVTEVDPLVGTGTRGPDQRSPGDAVRDFSSHR